MHKIGILVLASLETHEGRARVTNAVEVAKEFAGAGDSVRVVFDGGGAETAVRIADPEHKMHKLYTDIEEQVEGVCRFCARAFGVLEQAEELDLPLLAEFEQHPSVRGLVVEGYQIITF